MHCTQTPPRCMSLNGACEFAGCGLPRRQQPEPLLWWCETSTKVPLHRFPIIRVSVTLGVHLSTDNNPHRPAQDGAAPAPGARGPQDRPLLRVRSGRPFAAHGNICAVRALASLHLVRTLQRTKKAIAITKPPGALTAVAF